jgi:hypothetical protein
MTGWAHIVIRHDVRRQGDNYETIFARDHHSLPGFQHVMAKFSFYQFIPL